MKKWIVVILAFASLQVAGQMAPANSGATCGEVISKAGAAAVEGLSQSLAQQDEFSGKIKGKVVGVCEKKGCWMKLANDSEEEIMVKFENYGFFVPRDINGKQIVMEGVARKSVTSIDKLHHYAEDAGKSAEEVAKITEPKEEIIFTATGVLVL
ncbi:MAG: DUF4920 domain-containing protein [Ginsengibacter sp.]